MGEAAIYLPRKHSIECRRGQVIFDEDQPSNGIYLVVQGRVVVSVPFSDRRHTIIDIFSAGQLFGECGLLGDQARRERAVAVDDTELTSWSIAELEEQIERQPKLGLALLRIMADRCLGLEERFQAAALGQTGERVASALLHFARRDGVRANNGFYRIPPMTHQMIAEYVGTSREMVTVHMNQLRQTGCIEYSRRAILVHSEAVQKRLRGLASGPATAGERW